MTLSREFVDYKIVEHNDDFALVVGDEGSGIPELMAKQIDILAHIIMSGQTENLNVVAATGVALFQSTQFEECGARKVIFENLPSV